MQCTAVLYSPFGFYGFLYCPGLRLKKLKLKTVMHLSRLVHNVDAGPFASQLLHSTNERGRVCTHSAALRSGTAVRSQADDPSGPGAA